MDPTPGRWGPFWTPITPEAGSLLQAVQQPLERYNRYLKQQAEQNLLHALNEAERRKQAEEEEMQQAMRLWRDEQNCKTFSAENSAAMVLGSDAHTQSSGRPSSRQPRKKDASVDTFTRKRWRDLTAAQKLSVASREAFNKGGTAFNLNLSPAREASLLASKDLRGDLRDLVSSSLRKFGRADLPVAFILEANDAGRLHLHGVIGAQLSDEERQSLRKAMCEVFGEDAGMKRVRQMNTKPLHDAAGWSDYILKDQKQTERLLGISAEDQVFLNQAMIRSASGAFEELRQSRPRRKSMRSIGASLILGVQRLTKAGCDALAVQFPALVQTC